MEIFYTLNRDDYENLFKIFLKESVINERKGYKIQKKRIFTLLTFIFLFPIITIFTNGHIRALVFFIFTAVLYFFLFLAFQFIFKLCEISFKYKLKSKFKKFISEEFKNSSEIQNTLIIDNNYLTLIKEGKTINISYNCLKTLTLKGKFLIIKYKAKEQISIPLRAFKDEDEKERFINTLRKLSKENKEVPIKAPVILNAKIELQYSINENDIDNILTFVNKKVATLKQSTKELKIIMIGFQIVVLVLCLCFLFPIINELDSIIINAKVTFITVVILFILAEIYSIKFRVPKVIKLMVSKKFNAEIEKLKLEEGDKTVIISEKDLIVVTSNTITTIPLNEVNTVLKTENFIIGKVKDYFTFYIPKKVFKNEDETNEFLGLFHEDVLSNNLSI